MGVGTVLAFGSQVEKKKKIEGRRLGTLKNHYVGSNGTLCARSGINEEGCGNGEDNYHFRGLFDFIVTTCRLFVL